MVKFWRLWLLLPSRACNQSGFVERCGCRWDNLYLVFRCTLSCTHLRTADDRLILSWKSPPVKLTSRNRGLIPEGLRLRFSFCGSFYCASSQQSPQPAFRTYFYHYMVHRNNLPGNSCKLRSPIRPNTLIVFIDFQRWGIFRTFTFFIYLSFPAIIFKKEIILLIIRVFSFAFSKNLSSTFDASSLSPSPRSLWLVCRFVWAFHLLRFIFFGVPKILFIAFSVWISSPIFNWSALLSSSSKVSIKTKLLLIMEYLAPSRSPKSLFGSSRHNNSKLK